MDRLRQRPWHDGGVLSQQGLLGQTASAARDQTIQPQRGWNCLASILSVSDRTVREWLSRMDKDAKESRDRKIFELWLACWTDAEIGEEVGLTSQAVGQVLKEAASLPNLSKPDRAAADHAVDFDVPIYNIWKQQEKTAGSKHFGNSESRWLDNLSDFIKYHLALQFVAC